MMLVADKPSNDIGILQTKLSHREGHEARRIGLEAMPLDQRMEGRHGERQARLKIGPAPRHHLLHMVLCYRIFIIDMFLHLANAETGSLCRVHHPENGLPFLQRKGYFYP